jgi:hypothetical protein
VIGIALASHPKSQPTFSGRTVTQWLTGKDFATNQSAATVAVLALGEGSVPALRRMLHSGTKWDRVWFAKAPRWLYRRLPIGGHQFEHKDRAMWALKTLGRAGRQATPDLLAIAEDTTENRNQRYGAITTLRQIEAEPSVVIPVMDKLTNDPVVGRLAADQARSLRRVAESQRYAETQRSFAASRSTGREVQPAEFQPSSSFLDKGALWGPDKPKPPPINPDSNGQIIGTSQPSPPASDIQSSSTNGSVREKNISKLNSR